MSSYQYSAAYDSPRGSRDRYQDELEDTGDLETPVQTKAPSIPTISVTSPAKKSRKSRRHSDSDTETQPAQMSSRSSKHHSSSSSSSSKKHGSSSKSKSKAKAKPELTDDWTDVTVPEERRRIQNRIAQRKFREKAREQKEQAERDQRNQDLAGSSYHIPEPEDLGPDDEQLSGLPWGGPSMQYVVARGHESASQQGSRRASDHVFGDTPTYMNPYGGMYQGWDGQGSSGAEEMGYEESSPYYDYYDTSGGSSSR